MFGRIKLRKTDILFSKFLRAKIGHCESCYGRETLQCSHFYGRRHENTRYSLENCDVLDFTCHRKFTEDPALYRDWKFKKLGKRRFDILRVAAQTYRKRDDALAMLQIKALIKANNIIL